MLDELMSHARRALVEAGITGPHQSHTRRDNLSKIRAMTEGDADSGFGLSSVTKFSASEVLGFLAELTGCSPDIGSLDGEDTIDPDRTVAAIAEGAGRLAAAAARGETLLAVTGHPTGLLEHHVRVVDAYREAGGKTVLLREGERLRPGRRIEIRYTGGVGCLCDGASLLHTHSAAPMEALLEAGPWPDIVLGDHGFAGAAVERAIPAIAVMDINDPALAVAWAQHSDTVVIPMDDNRPPRLYEPSWRIFEAVLLGSAAGD